MSIKQIHKLKIIKTNKQNSKHESEPRRVTHLARQLFIVFGKVNMGKHKAEKQDGENLNESQLNNGEEGELSYEEKLAFASIIAQPMASKKLAGRVYKLVKKGEEPHVLGATRGSV